MANPASAEVHDFWKQLSDDWVKAVSKARPEIMLIGAAGNGAYQGYKRGETFDVNSQAMLRLYPSDIVVGDRVAVITADDGGKYILGKLFETADAEPPDNNWGPFVTTAFDQFASSTSSTTVYSQKISTSITLPAGTWTVTVLAWIQGTHSASGNVDFNLTFDGTTATAQRQFTSAANRSSTDWRVVKTGVASGSRNLVLEFKSNVAGTSTMYDALCLVLAVRTA